MQNFTEYTARGDHSFSEHDLLTLRYFYDSFSNQGYLDPANYLNFQNSSNILSQNALIGEMHLFGPGAVNEFRAGYSRETSNRGPAAGSISLADLGVNLYQPPTAKTIEGINVSGYFDPAQTDPAAFIRNYYNLSDDFSLVKGKHNLSFGGSAIRGQVLLRNQFRTSGSFSFTADVTNNALASFLQGYARTFTQGFGEYKDNLVTTYNLYVQDDYHVSRRLTLNLGLRYDACIRGSNKRIASSSSASPTISRVCSLVFTSMRREVCYFPGNPGVPKAGIGSDREWKDQSSRRLRRLLRCSTERHHQQSLCRRDAFQSSI